LHFLGFNKLIHCST